MKKLLFLLLALPVYAQTNVTTTGLTPNYVTKASGADTVVDSSIQDDGTTVTVNSLALRNATSGAFHALDFVTTLPSVTSIGAQFLVTGSGTAFDQRAVVARLLPGNAGAGLTVALQALDQSAGTGRLSIGSIRGSVGTFSAAIGATTGSKTGVYAFANDSSFANYGGVFVGSTGASPTINLGVAGIAGGQASGTAPSRVGVYGAFGSWPTTWTSAAILADNSGATTLPLFVARWNEQPVLRIPPAEQLQLVDQATQPTCDFSRRGSFWYDAGATGVADTFSVCVKDASDAYAWVEITL